MDADCCACRHESLWIPISREFIVMLTWAGGWVFPFLNLFHPTDTNIFASHSYGWYRIDLWRTEFFQWVHFNDVVGSDDDLFHSPWAWIPMMAQGHLMSSSHWSSLMPHSCHSIHRRMRYVETIPQKFSLTDHSPRCSYNWKKTIQLWYRMTIGRTWLSSLQ